MKGYQIESALVFIRNNLFPCYVTFGSKTLTADELTNVNLESKRCIYVVNTSRHFEKGKHWVIIDIINPNKVVFFDSFGDPPPEGPIEDFISKFKKISYNNERLQHYRSRACGAYCINYVYMGCKNKSLNEIVSSLVSEYKKYGTSASLARDFQLYQKVFSCFEIRFITSNIKIFYFSHLYRYMSVPLEKDEIEWVLRSLICNETSCDVSSWHVLAADDLIKTNFEEKGVYVVSTGKRGAEPKHWVIIEIVNHNKVVFFDSLGKPPEDEIAIFIYKFKEWWPCNNQAIQHCGTTASGVYCIYYALMRYENKPANEIIIDLFSKSFNKYGISPSIPSDFDLYLDIFLASGMPLIPFQNNSHLFWHMFLPMYEDQIKHALRCSIKCYKISVIKADELNEINLELERGVYVVNTSKRGEELQHWVIIEIENSNKVEFFDSLGNPPEGLIEDFISKFKERPCNNQKLQHSETKACGAYCIYYVYRRYSNLSQTEIVDSFVSYYENNFGTSPSVLRDFELYCDVFSTLGIPRL